MLFCDVRFRGYIYRYIYFKSIGKLRMIPLPRRVRNLCRSWDEWFQMIYIFYVPNNLTQSWLKSYLSLALVYWYVARARSDFEETPLGFTCRWPKIVTLANQLNSYFRGYESNKDMQRRISGNGINIHGSFRFPRIYRKSSRKQTRGNSVKKKEKNVIHILLLIKVKNIGF